MTLTRYLTRHVYSPLSLAMMRRRAARGLPVNRAAQKTACGFVEMIALPVFVTIGLAGIWHGSGAQFLVFGMLHASFLTINRAWRIWRGSLASPSRLGAVWRILLTYFCVLIGSVFFRAPSVPNALGMLRAMAGIQGIGPGIPVPARIAAILPGSGWLYPAHGHIMLHTVRDLVWLLALYAIVWVMPNTQQIFARARPVIETALLPSRPWLSWQPNLPWAFALGGLATLAMLSLGGSSEFLYFQF